MNAYYTIRITAKDGGPAPIYRETSKRKAIDAARGYSLESYNASVTVEGKQGEEVARFVAGGKAPEAEWEIAYRAPGKEWKRKIVKASKLEAALQKLDGKGCQVETRALDEEIGS